MSGSDPPAGRRHCPDSGTSLILALVFILILGMILVALGGLATGAMRTTVNLRDDRTLQEDAEASVTLAIQYNRYNYSSSVTATPSLCPPGVTIPASSDAERRSSNSTRVYCVQSDDPYSALTRVLDFYACPAGISAGSCTGTAVVLHAEVTYDDISPTTGANQCNGISNASCGAAMQVDTWDVLDADS